MEWNWLKTQFGSANGDAYSKLFKAEMGAHDLFAREVIQNSWDANDRLNMKSILDEGERVNFQVVFEFKKVTGSLKQSIVDALNLKSLKDKADAIGDEKLGFKIDDTVLSHIASEQPLKALYVHDFGATGLQGDPVGTEAEDSDFFRAFGELGGNDRGSGGGSYGFGKSAFIRASQIRCVIAYTSFSATANDSTTRRLWGFLYWNGFPRHTGVAQLGVEPLLDSEADKFAERLGFKIRTSDSPENFGTSLLIIDHVLNPEELLFSIAKNWWPAIEEFKNKFNIQVQVDNEPPQIPRPKDIPSLIPYLRAYEITREANAAQLKSGIEVKPNLQPINLIRVNKQGKTESTVKLGELALVHTQETESYNETNLNGIDFKSRPLFESDDHYAHVALIRKPRMVVEYKSYGGSSPKTAIQGVFVSSNDADPFLRKSEPGIHNKWDANADNSSERENVTRIVTAVHDRVKSHVLNFQKNLRGPRQTKSETLLVVNQLLKKLFIPPPSKGKLPGRPGEKPLSRSTKLYTSTAEKPILEFGENKDMVITQKWRVQLNSSIDEDTKVKIEFRVLIVSDGEGSEKTDRVFGEEWVEIDGFEIARHDDVDVLVGYMKPGKSYNLEVRSGNYDQNWTVTTDLIVEKYFMDSMVLETANE